MISSGIKSVFIYLAFLLHLRTVLLVCVTEVVDTSVNFSPNGDF